MDLNFRPCRAEDIDAAIPLMLAAGPDSFRYVFSIDEENEVLGFLRYAFKKGDGEFGFKNHVIALKGEKPVALMGVWDSKNNFPYMFSALKNILSYFGVRIGLKVLVRGMKAESVINPPRKDVLCLHNFSVDEAVRGGGIGNMSVEHFIQLAKNKKINVVSLTVNENNASAKKLYERLGFKTVKQTKGGLKNKFGSVDGHYYMEKNIEG